MELQSYDGRSSFNNKLHCLLMITFYMLQETAQVLTIDTIKLLEKPDVHEIFTDTVGLSIHLFNIG